MAGAMGRLLLAYAFELEEGQQGERYRRTRPVGGAAAFSMPDAEFLRQYRMSKEKVTHLCGLLRPELTKEFPDRNRYVLSVEDEVLVALLFYGSGAFQHSIASNYEHGMSQASVSRAIERVTNAIITRMRGYIRFPTDDAEVIAVKESFCQRCSFPDVLGAIDCTHIAIKAPSKDPNAYLDRKGNFSINVQLICDNECRITDVVARWPGGTHDAFIWRFSGVLERFKAGEMPEGYLLGDSGYPLQPFLMTPLLQAATPSEQRYNERHMSGRNVIERVNGILKMRFRCLDTSGGALWYIPEKVCAIISACCILHNYCLDEPMPAGGGAAANPNVGGHNNVQPQNDNELLQSGRLHRQILINLECNGL